MVMQFTVDENEVMVKNSFGNELRKERERGGRSEPSNGHSADRDAALGSRTNQVLCM